MWEGGGSLSPYHDSLDLKVELWKSFSDGGELEWIKDTKLLADLSDASSIIQTIKNAEDKYFQSTFYSGTSQVLIYCKHFELLIEGELKAARDIFGKVFQTIDSHL